jgi:hypothetical protein
MHIDIYTITSLNYKFKLLQILPHNEKCNCNILRIQPFQDQLRDAHLSSVFAG